MHHLCGGVGVGAYIFFNFFDPLKDPNTPEAKLHILDSAKETFNQEQS